MKAILAAGFLTLAIAGAVVAQSPALLKEVDAHKKRAAEFAAKKQWDEALHEISDAKEAVRSAGKNPVNIKTPPPDPRFVKELKEYQNHLLRQAKAQGNGKKLTQNEMKLLLVQIKTHRAALEKKYHVANPNQEFASKRDQVDAIRARLALISSELDDVAAGYYKAKGDTDHAAGSREEALLTRLRAYRTLKRSQDEETAADKLLKLPPAEAQSYGEIGRRLGYKKQWARAAQVWKQAIQALETGTAKVKVPASSNVAVDRKNSQLAEFYKELGFCQFQMGQKTEAELSMKKAKQLQPTSTTGLR